MPAASVPRSPRELQASGHKASFPPPQVFLPLVARLVNDPSSKCRQMVGACLSTLLRRAPPARRDRLAQFCSQWLGGADARLTRAAAQVRGSSMA